MITIRDHHTGDLFDPWEHLGPQRRRLLDRSWAGVFREYLLAHLPVEELASHFRHGMGRPSKDLYAAVGVLILQQLHDLTDAGAVEALAFNITWHYALDIRDESDAYICERTVRNYRRIVIEHGLDEALFRGLTDRLIEAFGVDTSKQRIDSTSLRSAMRTLTRLGIIVETIGKFLRELARKHPRLMARVDPDLIRRYVDREGPGCFELSKPSESRRRLPEAARDLMSLVRLFGSTTGRALESFKLLERVLDEQCEVIETEQAVARVEIREPKTVSCESVQNPADPDASYNARRGQGYAAQVMETYVEDDEHGVVSGPDLITHVAVHKMTVHDAQRLAPALEDVSSRGVAPCLVLGDSHYGSIDNMKRSTEQGIELVSPAMPAKGSNQGKLTLDDFEIDDAGLVFSCPAGHAPVSTGAGVQRNLARFDTAVCESCSLQDRCPTQVSVARGEAPRLQYTPQRAEQRRRRRRDHGTAFKDRYRWRAGLEATMSRLKHQMNLAHLRVRGHGAVSYATFLRALGLNIRRCAVYADTS